MSGHTPPAEGTPLSESEIQVLFYLSKGYRLKEIEPFLNRKWLTLQSYHCKNIRAKLGVSTMCEAVAVAVRTGVI